MCVNACGPDALPTIISQNVDKYEISFKSQSFIFIISLVKNMLLPTLWYLLVNIKFTFGNSDDNLFIIVLKLKLGHCPEHTSPLHINTFFLWSFKNESILYVCNLLKSIVGV